MKEDSNRRAFPPMRLLNVELLVCDRCGKRFEMRLEDGEHCNGYGTVTVRNISARPVTPRRGGLSCREQKVLEKLIEGKPNKTIARELECADATVKVHVKSIMRKMGLRNRTQVAVMTCNGNGHEPGVSAKTQAITNDVDRNADLCRECLAGLNAYLNNKDWAPSLLREDLTEEA